MLSKRNAILLLLVVAITAYPLIFEGKAVSTLSSDDAGPAWIESTGYIPWFHSLYTPPNSDIEAGLFALQAAVGAGIIGYVFGYWNAQAKARKQEKNNE